MYRSLGKLSSFGVVSGPYTGKPRRLAWHLLPEDVKRRLVAALEGRGRPSPIAIDVPSPSRLAKRLVGLATVGTLMLGALVVHSWPRAQPSSFSVLFAIAVLPVALLGALLLHRRFVRGGSPLDPGKVLFPLDLLSFDGAALTLTPLGSVRDVGILGDAGTPADPLRLVLRFESGEEASFPMPSAVHADRTYDALVEAQKTLEVLSYSEDIERSLDHDPFFAVRAGTELDACAAPPRRSPPVPLVAAFVPAALLALGAGHLAFVATANFSDEMRFQKAFTENTESAMQDYLARGGSRLKEAEYFLATRRTERRKTLELDRMRDRVARNEALLAATVSAQPKNPPGFAMPKTPDQWNVALGQCLRDLLTQAAPHSKVMPALTTLIDEARRGVGGPARLAVRYERTFAPDFVPSLELVSALDARERETARALAVVLADVCPPSILAIAHEPGKKTDGHALVVRYELRKPVARELGGRQYPLSEVRFDTTIEVWPKKPAGFSLVMPAPEAASTTTRERSVSRVDDDGPASKRVYGAFTARAFDRLYDELYGLFFSGPVKVPLPGFAEVERIFMK